MELGDVDGKVDPVEGTLQLRIDDRGRGNRRPSLVLPDLIEVILLGDAPPHAIAEVGEQEESDDDASRPHHGEDVAEANTRDREGMPDKSTAGGALPDKTPPVGVKE